MSRAGETCGVKPCWKPLGATPPDGKGFAYKDPAGAADGVTVLKLKATAGGAKISAAASNAVATGRTALPTGIAAALTATTSVRVQLYVTGGTCVEATLDQVKKQTPTLFKAR